MFQKARLVNGARPEKPLPFGIRPRTPARNSITFRPRDFYHRIRLLLHPAHRLPRRIGMTHSSAFAKCETRLPIFVSRAEDERIIAPRSGIPHFAERDKRRDIACERTKNAGRNEERGEKGDRSDWFSEKTRKQSFVPRSTVCSLKKRRI